MLEQQHNIVTQEFVNLINGFIKSEKKDSELIAGFNKLHEELKAYGGLAAELTQDVTFVSYFINFQDFFQIKDDALLKQILLCYGKACTEKKVVVSYKKIHMHPMLLLIGMEESQYKCLRNVICDDILKIKEKAENPKKTEKDEYIYHLFKSLGGEEPKDKPTPEHLWKTEEDKYLFGLFNQFGLKILANRTELYSLLFQKKRNIKLAAEYVSAWLYYDYNDSKNREYLVYIGTMALKYPGIRIRALHDLFGIFKGLDLRDEENKKLLFSLWEKGLRVRISTAQARQLVKDNKDKEATIYKYCLNLKSDSESSYYITSQQSMRLVGENSKRYLEQEEADGANLYKWLSGTSFAKDRETLIDYMLSKDQDAFEEIGEWLHFWCKSYIKHDPITGLLEREIIDLNTKVDIGDKVSWPIACYIAASNYPLYSHYYKNYLTSDILHALVFGNAVALAAPALINCFRSRGDVLEQLLGASILYGVFGNIIFWHLFHLEKARQSLEDFRAIIILPCYIAAGILFATLPDSRVMMVLMVLGDIAVSAHNVCGIKSAAYNPESVIKNRAICWFVGTMSAAYMYSRATGAPLAIDNLYEAALITFGPTFAVSGISIAASVASETVYFYNKIYSAYMDHMSSGMLGQPILCVSVLCTSFKVIRQEDFTAKVSYVVTTLGIASAMFCLKRHIRCEEEEKYQKSK